MTAAVLAVGEKKMLRRGRRQSMQSFTNQCGGVVKKVVYVVQSSMYTIVDVVICSVFRTRQGWVSTAA